MGKGFFGTSIDVLNDVRHNEIKLSYGEPLVSEPFVAQKGPYPIELQAGRSYWWCACGHSSQQPFCDGSHGGTGLKPVIFVATETKTYYLCGCKHTKDKPFCDGTHSSLA